MTNFEVVNGCEIKKRIRHFLLVIFEFGLLWVGAGSSRISSRRAEVGCIAVAVCGDAIACTTLLLLLLLLLVLLAARESNRWKIAAECRCRGACTSLARWRRGGT